LPKLKFQPSNKFTCHKFVVMFTTNMDYVSHAVFF
jgi:hypothetical protein